jgi:hypothetical protein
VRGFASTIKNKKGISQQLIPFLFYSFSPELDKTSRGLIDR